MQPTDFSKLSDEEVVDQLIADDEAIMESADGLIEMTSENPW